MHIDNDTITKENLEYFYCADLNNFTVGGDWSSDVLGEISYQAKRCNAEIEAQKNITCASDEEIMNKYDGIMYIDLKWQNAIIDPTNHIKPVKRTIDYKYQVLDISLRKENQVTYTDSHLITDEGIIFEDIKQHNLFQIQSSSINVGIEGKSILSDPL